MDFKARLRSRQSGFSLLEMLMVLAIFTIVMGVVFTQISSLQQRYKAEESKLDMSQESREFIDQISRDMHQAGYPKAAMYDPAELGNPPENSTKNAVGLVSYSATDLLFEGDVDGDGQVNSVRYTLQAGPDGKCPCGIGRSQVKKLAGSPTSQAVNYNTELQGVINSGGTLAIAGSTVVIRDSKKTTTTNDVLYEGYKAAPVFAAFDADGVAVNPTTDPTTLKRIRTVRVTLNVLAPYTDAQLMTRPVITLVANARVGNNLK